MRRTNAVTKFISILLCGFLVAYFGVSIVQSMRNPLLTAPAIMMQTEDGFFASGIIVRDETVITVSHPVVSSLVREGERVSVGMAYMVAYATVADRDRDIRHGQLEREIAHLETLLAMDSGVHQVALQEAEVREQIRELGYATRMGNLERLEDQTVALRSLAMASDREGLVQRIGILEAELAVLQSAVSAANVTPIFADQSGLFSARLDGYEFLSPEDLRRFDAQVVRELLERRGTGLMAGAGKLVSGTTWYYVALVPESEVGQLADRLVGPVPNRVIVRFSGLPGLDIPMRVHSVGPYEDGYRVTVFAANTAMAETLGLRQTEARIVFQTYSGIRVPREALHFGAPNADGVRSAYVFTLTLGSAERKFVQVVYEGEDFFLVRPDMARTTEAAALREGNSIIVRARELYDGRVFR